LRLGEILVHCGSLTRRELDEALQLQHHGASEPLGQLLVEQRRVQQPIVEAALVRQKQIKESRSAEHQSVRVDAEKLDRLVDLVGELITATATATQAGRHVQNAALQESHSTLNGLVQEIRDSALQLRMVRIGATFNRFQRMVHDVSREIGKDIVLQVRGEDTELDKTVVEKIADPLTHLVRNSMDHGIEPVALRIERGKPAWGTVSLNAYHDSGSIVIEVGDDGGGLSRDRILAKAVERGLVDAGKALADEDIYNLIFEPGFSTADQVTNLSGRGVGMDVVKRNIAALRGTVSLDSRPGLGTKTTVRLPLTLAIINGFQVAVGRSVFVLPLEAIEECIEFREDSGHDYTELRGRVLPFIRLRALFHVPDPAGSRQSIVVVREGSQRFGLIVDRLLGEAQAVIKPLAQMFAHLQGISGSSILGTGEVALILDIPALAAKAMAAQRPVSDTVAAAP
ncbi:chemotaxis protein CheA, partial [Paracidovorax cattleyae]